MELVAGHAVVGASACNDVSCPATLAKCYMRLRPFYELRKILLIKEHACRILLIAYPNRSFCYRFLLIKENRQLLRDPRTSVLEASVRTGFVDQSHFTKAFRRLVGATPTLFRSQI
jgi:hypothetical protein